MSYLLLLGAGASRGVSYANAGFSPSPLDADFYDLLQRLDLNDAKSTTQQAVRFVLDQMEPLPSEYRSSFEKAFYTLHLKSELIQALSPDSALPTSEMVVRSFARAIQLLLRKAHGMKTCVSHNKLVRRLRKDDLIISFNYDLVVERSLRRAAEARGDSPFGPWVYSYRQMPPGYKLPLLLKLHGSSNWKISKSTNKFSIRTKQWTDLDEAPGYRAYEGEGTSFPIFLPFWEKRVEREPWLSLWKLALRRLGSVESMVVWGYSLPVTDVRVQHFFSYGLSPRIKLCVVDPSKSTRQRWRDLLPRASYWEYTSIADFFRTPPPWWTAENRPHLGAES